MTAVIGLTGLKGSGKDTAALALIQDGWRRVALADPVREMLYTLNPIVGDPDGHPHTMRWQEYLDAVGYDNAKKHPEVRRLMQVFATDVVREQIDQETWLNLGMQKIRSEPQTKWVLTDVRFDNEAKRVHNLGGFVVRIDRDGLSADGHSSEAGVSEDLVDAVIKNNGDIEELHLQMRGVAKVLGSIRRSQ